MALSVDHNVCVLQRQNELNAVSGSSSNRFEQFVSDPLLFLSKLYSAATSQATRTGHNPPLESDHVSLTMETITSTYLSMLRSFSFWPQKFVLHLYSDLRIPHTGMRPSPLQLSWNETQPSNAPLLFPVGRGGGGAPVSLQP